MGTDIHTIAQIQRKDGSWQTVETEIAGDLCDYDTYAVLAGVRNDPEKRVLPLGKPWKVIAEPRGLPADLVVTADIWLGHHHYSWLKLSELKEYWQNEVEGKEIVMHGYEMKLGELLPYLRAIIVELESFYAAKSNEVSEEQVRLVFGFSE